MSDDMVIPAARSGKQPKEARKHPLTPGLRRTINKRRYATTTHRNRRGTYPVILDVSADPRRIMIEALGFGSDISSAFPEHEVDCLLRDIAVRNSELARYGIVGVTAVVRLAGDGSVTISYRVRGDDGATELIPDEFGVRIDGCEHADWTAARHRLRTLIHHRYRPPLGDPPFPGPATLQD